MGEKVIHWDLCKKLKLNHTTKYYMHKPEFVLENKTQNSLEIEIQTDHLTHSRRPDIEIINKRKKDGELAVK